MTDHTQVSRSGQSKKKQGFIMQAGILAAASIICRMIGLLYKSPLTAIIGDEGNGYYATAYTIYTIILLVSSYSIPSAMAKVLAQRLALREYRNAQRIFQCALLYVMIVGGAASLLLFVGAPWFVMGHSIPVLRVFAPTIFFYGILGVLRGYFQAHSSMVQTSFSQILEQILNAVVSMGAAWVMMGIAARAGKDPGTQAMYGAIGSALGTGAGVLVGLIFMIGVYGLNHSMIHQRLKKDRSDRLLSWKEIFILIIAVVTPFILSTCIYNLTTSLNQTIYLKMMVYLKQMDEIKATMEYGVFAQKAVTISNIPIALASAMSAAIVPAVSAAFAKKAIKETRKKVAEAIKITMLISIPAAIGICALAKPIVLLLFPQRDSLDLAAKLLMGLSVTVIFYGLSTLTNAVLQGIGRVNVPVTNAVISLFLQTVVLIPVLYLTDWGIMGVMLASVLYSFFMCILNNLFLRKYLRYRQEADRTFLRPFLAAAVMGGAAFGSYQGVIWLMGRLPVSEYLGNLVALAAAVCIGGAIYFVLVLKLKAVNEKELRSLPKGGMLVRVARKFRLL